MRREIRNIPGEGAHVAVVAMNHQQRRPAAIDFRVHLEAVNVVEPAGGLIVVVRDGRRFLRSHQPGAEREREPDRGKYAQAEILQQVHQESPWHRSAYRHRMINHCAEPLAEPDPNRRRFDP